MAPTLFALLVFQCVLGLCEVFAEARGRKENRKAYYDFQETISNLGVFSLNIFRVLLVVPVFFLYGQLLQVSKPFHFDWSKAPIVTWVLALIAADFAYYLFHILSHRWNILWGGHLVHHQPEHWNLSISGRDSIWGRAIICLIGLPMALTGMPALSFFFAVFFGNAYMGWLHTNLPVKLGPLEYVFNTPTHHKIHHYKDIARIGGTKNLGGVFIFWDRIFGTYWEEEDKKRDYEYGIRDTPKILEPLRSQVFFYRHLFNLFFKVPAKDRLRLLFSHYLPEPVPAESEPARARSYRTLDWVICFLLLVLIYKSASSLSLGMTYRLMEGTFDGEVFLRVAVACVATFLGMLQVSKILYGAERTSSWDWGSLVLVGMLVFGAFLFLALPASDNLMRDALIYFLGSRAYLVLGALVAIWR